MTKRELMTYREWESQQSGKIRYGQPVDHVYVQALLQWRRIITVFKSSPPKDDDDMDARPLAEASEWMTRKQLQDYIRSNP